MKTTLDISTLVNEEEGSIVYEFYREDFEKCNMELFRKAIQITVDGVASKNINRSSIREIILVGGSSQILGIRRRLLDTFQRAEIKEDKEDLRTVVAKGALMYQRDVKANLPDVEFERVLIHDVLIETDQGPEIIIHKGEPIPHEHDTYMRINKDGFSTRLYQDYDIVNGVQKPKQVKEYRYYHTFKNVEYLHTFICVDREERLSMKATHSEGYQFVLESTVKSEEREKENPNYFEQFMKEYL